MYLKRFIFEVKSGHLDKDLILSLNLWLSVSMALVSKRMVWEHHRMQLSINMVVMSDICFNTDTPFYFSIEISGEEPEPKGYPLSMSELMKSSVWESNFYRTDHHPQLDLEKHLNKTVTLFKLLIAVLLFLQALLEEKTDTLVRNYCTDVWTQMFILMTELDPDVEKQTSLLILLHQYHN